MEVEDPSDPSDPARRVQSEESRSAPLGRAHTWGGASYRKARGVRDLGEVDVLVLSGGAVVGAGQRRVQRLDGIAARQHAFGRLHALERRGKDGLGVVEAGDLLPDLLRVVEPLRRGSLRYGLLPRRDFEEFERPLVLWI